MNYRLIIGRLKEIRDRLAEATEYVMDMDAVDEAVDDLTTLIEDIEEARQ